MKKKILIALFVVLMACLFAFSVSAANEVTLTDGTTADLATVFKMNNDKTQITGFNSGYDKNMVTDVIFPDEIEGLEANSLFNSATNLNSLTFAATDTFFISGDGIFSKCSVKTITFNPDCVVEIRKGNFSGCTSLTEITFPKFKKLATSSFASCSNMVATNELILAEGMTEIGGHAFNGCTSLTGTVVFPATLEKIQEYSFQNTGFTGFDLSKCANLTVAGGGYGGPFTNNDNITTLDLSGCTSLTYLKNSFASDCAKLEKVILPPNLETIESKALAHCYKLQSIVLPASLTYVADEAFHSARAGQSVKTFTMYIQGNVKLESKYVFRDTGAKIEFVLLGDSVTAEQFKTTNAGVDIVKNGSHSLIDNIQVMSYTDSASPWTFTPGQTRDSHVIVENYCTPLALTGEHASDDNPCVIYCSSCQYANAKENPVHKESVSIKYENGYNNVGIKVITCTNPGCAHEETAEVKALFKCLGYSAQSFGNGGILAGFGVNDTAISEYANITGKNFKFGLFAGRDTKLGTSDAVNTDGEALTGIVSVDYTERGFDIVELKVIGFTTDEHKNANLALGLYVIDGESISYVQATKPSEGEKYCFVSYNDIVG